MPEIEFTLEQLRGMIGLSVRHRDLICEIIEVLEDEGPLLVLEAREGPTDLQESQFGEPTRRVRHTFTVAVLDGDRCSLHSDFLDLELL